MASPSAFDLFRDAQNQSYAAHSSPPPVPPKPPTPRALPSPSSSAAVLSRAEQIMRQGSPSRLRSRPRTLPRSQSPVLASDMDGVRTYPRPLPVPQGPAVALSELAGPLVPNPPKKSDHAVSLFRPPLPSPPCPPSFPPLGHSVGTPLIPTRTPSPPADLGNVAPPVPVIMIDGEVMTDDMMDPIALRSDANIATSDAAPAPQHASSTSAEERATWQGSRISEGITAACHRCGRWIGGAMVHAMGHAWHARCFTCAHCGTPLEHVSFYEHEGQPYCHLDFHELFSRWCYHCKTPIVEERFVTVDAFGESRAYHEMHFFCASCGDPFIDPKDGEDTSSIEASKPFFVHGGHAYCEACHQRLHRPKCHACRKPVGDEHIQALRAVWHRECFVCTRCRKPCLGAVFAAPDGSPCDFDCYQAWVRRGQSGPAPPAPPAFLR